MQAFAKWVVRKKAPGGRIEGNNKYKEIIRQQGSEKGMAGAETSQHDLKTSQTFHLVAGAIAIK